MATNAERQAAYRARHLKDVDGTGERLNLIVDAKAKRALERLAVHYAVTQRSMIEKLLIDAERAAIDAVATVENGQANYYARVTA